MNELERAAAARAERRAQIEPLIRAYPDLVEDEMSQLLSWYRQEASAFDIAMLSNDAETRPGYLRFRQDHIDHLNWRDYLKFLLFAAAGIMFVGVLAWM